MNPPPEQEIKHHYAGIFLITETGKVVGQKRDDKPGIDNPGKVAGFGGTVEIGEQPKEAIWRELTQEETNLNLNLSDIHYLFDDIVWRKLTNEWEVRHFYYALIKEADLNTIEIYEGQGWAYINSPEDQELAESWRPVVKNLFDKLNLAKQ